jgi:anaerobic magnesium-protoporphyrin IX monomethyl ester cyclase
MKVTLISVDDELYCIGIRVLSSCLRRAGHHVECLFLPPGRQEVRAGEKFRTAYSPKLLEKVWHHCADSQLVGISLMTNYFIRAVNLTEYLKGRNIKAPIIWGGVHPTVEPETCLQYADMVCIGEGEDALVELADNMKRGASYSGTRNIWVRTGQDIVRNTLRPLVQDLDGIPFPDYGGVDHFLASEDGLEKLTPDCMTRFEGERFRARPEGIYYPVMTSRGCPFSCSYCCNSVYKRLYPGQKRLRWRSVENVIGELKMAANAIGRLGCVLMVDDNFTAQSEENLRKFCTQYRREIGVPFACQCSPLTINEEKMNILLDGGCAKIVMGVESASERIATMYNRGRFHSALPMALALIEKYRSRMRFPPSYQFIIDNPYETLEETLQTLRMATDVKKPWDNPIYSLMLFPGTPLFEIAMKDGFVSNKTADVYGKDWLDQSKPFFRFWIRLYRANYPRPLLRALLIPFIARVLSGDRFKALWRTRLFRR